MKNKPLLFIILGALHLVEPLIKVLYFKATTPFSFPTILSNIASISGPRELFEFWLLFPLGGLALLSVKRWSYPIFVGVQAYSIWAHVTYQKFTWPYVSEVPFYSSLFLLAMNVMIIIYFALPDVRRPFFDKNVRWWEHRPRYILNLPCTLSISNPNLLHDADILNISLSGAFINYRGVIEPGVMMRVNISLEDQYVSVKAIVIGNHCFDRQRGIGVKFKYDNIWQNLAMRKLVRTISKRVREHEKMTTKLAA